MTPREAPAAPCWHAVPMAALSQASIDSLLANGPDVCLGQACATGSFSFVASSGMKRVKLGGKMFGFRVGFTSAPEVVTKRMDHQESLEALCPGVCGLGVYFRSEVQGWQGLEKRREMNQNEAMFHGLSCTLVYKNHTGGSVTSN